MRQQLEAYRQKYSFNFLFGFPEHTETSRFRYSLMPVRACPQAYVERTGSKSKSKRPHTC